MLKAQVAALRRPPIDVAGLLEGLQRLGLERSTAELRALLAAEARGVDPFP